MLTPKTTAAAPWGLAGYNSSSVDKCKHNKMGFITPSTESLCTSHCPGSLTNHSHASGKYIYLYIAVFDTWCWNHTSELAVKMSAEVEKAPIQPRSPGKVRALRPQRMEHLGQFFIIVIRLDHNDIFPRLISIPTLLSFKRTLPHLSLQHYLPSLLWCL